MNKSILMTSFLLVTCVSVIAVNTADAETINFTKSTVDTVTFSATAMGCSTDSKMVETALYRKKGVKNVKIDGENITVIYDSSKVKPEELKSVIENTGSCEDPDAKVHKVKIKTN